MYETCRVMHEGEILNEKHSEWPLFDAVIYGSRTECAKFSKRLSCAVKHLPLRVKFSFEYDTVKAIEKGVAKDPTLVIDGKIFMEGLPQAELITEKFQSCLNRKTTEEN
jgi:hypothetical protein